MIGQYLGNRYLIKEQIGRGGMAAIYLAQDDSLKRKVAVKVLHQQFASNSEIRDRLRLEARAISQLDHPNIIKVYDFSGDTEKLWIVTEILDGINLDQFVQNYVGRKLHPIVATLIVSEVCKALEHAHKYGIIHRDVKPKNVMILRTGQVKLMDFGIAKDVHGPKTTLTGVFIGSPSYMSPEQIDPTKNIDSRSDIYSLCVLYYEIVTGFLPFSSDHSVKLAKKILSGKFVEPIVKNPILPVSMNQMICKGLQSSLQDRYRSIQHLRTDLSDYLTRNGFMESHIELERYFKNPQNFNNRLMRFDEHQSTVANLSPSAGKSLAQPQETEATYKEEPASANGQAPLPEEGEGATINITAAEALSEQLVNSADQQERLTHEALESAYKDTVMPSMTHDEPQPSAALSEDQSAKALEDRQDDALKQEQNSEHKAEFDEEISTSKIRVAKTIKPKIDALRLDQLEKYSDRKEKFISVHDQDPVAASIQPPVIASNISSTDMEMTIKPSLSASLSASSPSLSGSGFAGASDSLGRMDMNSTGGNVSQSLRAKPSFTSSSGFHPQPLDNQTVKEIRKRIRYQKMVNSIEKIVSQQMREEKYARRNSWKEYVYGVIVTAAIIGFSIWGYKGFEQQFEDLLHSSKTYFSKLKKNETQRIKKWMKE